MKRVTAIQRIIPFLGDALVVNCNGMISREMFTYADSANQFYMIGSMGLAGPIGLGVALGQYRCRSTIQFLSCPAGQLDLWLHRRTEDDFSGLRPGRRGTSLRIPSSL